MAETEEFYVASVGLGPIVQKLVKGVCEDRPETLLPYMLHKLCDAYPAAAKEVGEIDAEAMAWKKSEKDTSSKTKLLEYLDSVRWSSTIGALTELVIARRPKNPVPVMISILAKGDLSANAEVEVPADVDAAAAKMQSLQRGRNARKALAEQKAAKLKKEQEEQDAAAIRMQAVRRGQSERKKAKEAALQRAQEADAATKVQAITRGRNARKSVGGTAAEPQAAGEPAESSEPAAETTADAAEDAAANAEMESAAARMQAVQRGKKSRDEFMAKRKEREEQAAAATKMQSITRGKKARIATKAKKAQ